jgi:glutathione S-transferase
MPAFTLYGSRGSTNTDRVRLTLAESGFTDYELVLLNLQKGEQKVGDHFSFLITSHCPFSYVVPFSWNES